MKIIARLVALFTGKNGDYFARESDMALDGFKRSIQKLKNINAAIAERSEELVVERKAIDEEEVTLVRSLTRNDKVIVKLEEFIG